MDDFILVYDNFMDAGECQQFINCFERFDSVGMTVTRNKMGDKNHVKSDNQVFFSSLLGQGELDIMDMEPFRNFSAKFWDTIYPLYTQKYSVIAAMSQHTIRWTKIQKTGIGEGYHVWHCEDDSPHTMRRIMTFILYLNDVVEGGETEFIYYPKRVKAQTGRIVLWPAGYTHAHRGNPPLSNTKYIVTGWVEFN
jgi:hypothetical protein